MKETVKLTCIECPRGCDMTVILNGGEVETVDGNFCPKGRAYAKQEVVRPTRVVTSTVRLNSGEMLSVKTDKAIAKELIFEVMKCINVVKCSTPVKIGDIIIKNVADTDSNVVATRNA